MKRQSQSPDLWFLLAHGAGASMSSSWMVHYRDMLQQFGPVEPFDYPYMAAHKKRPDPLERLIDAHREVLAAKKAVRGDRVVLVGKSMGGRVGCHLALTESVSGVICLGYPLLAMGNPEKKRDKVLYELKVPALFVQGTRDSMCPLPQLKEVLSLRGAPSHLHVVESGNHSLQPTKTYLKQAGLSETDLEARTMQAISSFIAGL